MDSATVVACLAAPYVHLLSYWIPVLVLAVAFALCSACIVLEVRRRRFRWLPMYAALLALQPGWGLLWQELQGGAIRVRADCGYGQRALSLFLLGGIVALLVIVARRSPLKRRSFVFGVAAAFTAMSVLSEGYMLLSDRFPRVLAESVVFHEVQASFFSGFGGRPMELLILLLICVVLYVVQRWRSNAV